MKCLITALVLISLQGIARGAALEQASLAAPLIKYAAPLPLPAIPLLKSEPVGATQDYSTEWITAVKRKYLACPQGGLPPAAVAELPGAAVQQMQWDAATYPSKAYKITVEGRVAFVIENDNLDALYVNIFDEDGRHIAHGGFDENYDFYWLSRARSR